jgi:hypothetical protein
VTAARFIGFDIEPVTTLLTRMPNGLDVSLPDEPVAYWASGLVEALVLSSYVFDVRRRRPVIVVTPARHGRHRVDPDVLATAVWRDADVVGITDHETVQAVCAALPTWLAVHDGGVRLYAPGADIADDSHRHPGFRYEQAPGRTLDKVAHAAKRAARARHLDPAVALDAERKAHNLTRQDLSLARQEISGYKTALDNDGNDGRAVFSDREVQFEHDLYLAWLSAVPETDRDTWDLSRDYTFGPGFLDSVEQNQMVSRQRIARACVDVITRRYPEIPGREAKLLLDGTATTGKGRPPLVRTEDRAKAWRCAVQTRGAGAVRLMWWELPDGSAELSRVAEHDDARII